MLVVNLQLRLARQDRDKADGLALSYSIQEENGQPEIRLPLFSRFQRIPDIVPRMIVW